MIDEEEPQDLRNLRLLERHLENKLKAVQALDWTGREALAQITRSRLQDQLERINLQIIKML